MMRLTVAAWMAALGLALAAPALAQGQPAAKAAPAKKAAAKKKVVVVKKAPPPAPDLPPPPADDAQKAAAEMVYTGQYACELGKSVAITPSAAHEAYVDVAYGKRVYLSKPVLSSTGAVRLEDVKGQTLMVQIAQKSMLLDVKAGQRLADECVSEKQAETRRVAAEAAAREAAEAAAREAAEAAAVAAAAAASAASAAAAAASAAQAH